MNERMKLIAASAITAGVITPFLTGCGNQTETTNQAEIVTSIENEVELEFWHGMSGSMGETLNELIQTFNENRGEELGITVEGVYQGGYTDLNSKLMASIKAGTSPILIQGTSNSIMDLLPSGVVQPLDDYIYHDEIGMDDYEVIYEAFRQEGQSFDEAGTVYGLPFSKSTDLYYYDEAFFEEHELEVPTTWEEAEAVSKQITEITNRPGMGIDNVSNFFITLLEQYGADYTNSKGEILFNHETSVKILEQLKTNVEAGYWRIPGEDMYHSGPFLSGLVQSYIGSSAGYTFLTDDVKWNTAPLPQVDASNSAFIQQGNMVSILNQNKTSEEIYGAYEFLKFLMSEQAVLEWSTKTGYLPIKESVATSEEYLTHLEETNDRVKKNGAISLENAFVEAMFVKDNGVSSNMVRNEVYTMIEEILLSGVEIQDALNQYEQKLK
ncbi:MAG: ABC transporter substrate-binding protein [Turicibacter sp.]|nr:ABC transporter substrate-binding protein [Turicibacter sp.]